MAEAEVVKTELPELPDVVVKVDADAPAAEVKVEGDPAVKDLVAQYKELETKEAETRAARDEATRRAAAAADDAARARREAEASSALSWKLNGATLQQLRAHPAVAGLRFETRRLELKQDRRWGKRG